MESVAAISALLGLAGLLCATALPLAVLVGIGVYVFRRKRRRDAALQAAQGWSTTSGVVVASTLKVQRTVRSRSEIPVVVYQYQVEGGTYTGSRIRAGDQFFAIRLAGDARTTVARYPVGTPVTVFYDPANPAESALER